jgi:hypothetical protein
VLTIEIPKKIKQLVVIAQMGEFPASCWATDIVSNWLWDIAEHAGYDDPEKCPMTQAICEELGINHDDFVNVGGELYRQHAEALLKQALGIRPNKEAFLQVSAMVHSQLILGEDRKTFELDWDNIVGGSIQGPDSNLPMPVWQCLMRYYHKQWHDPISVWHHDIINWIQLNYELISYPTDQLVPFPATA